jgi:hypothetical protein
MRNARWVTIELDSNWSGCAEFTVSAKVALAGLPLASVTVTVITALPD